MSIAQLSIRLEHKGYTQEEINQAVNQLLEWKYLDDHQYALTFCNSKRLKWSRVKVKISLQEAGVNSGIIGKALQERYPEDLEYENCLQEAKQFLKEENQKWEKKYKNSPTYAKFSKEMVLRKKIGEKLIRKGFSFTQVNKVLSELIFGKT